MSRTVERCLIAVALIGLLLFVMHTKSTLAKRDRADNNRFSHLDRRISTLRTRMDAQQAPPPPPPSEPTASEQADEPQPAAFDPSGGMSTFDMPQPMNA